MQKICRGDGQPPPLAPSFIQEDAAREHGSWLVWKAVGIGYTSTTISIAYISSKIERPKWLMRTVRMMERRDVIWIKKPKMDDESVE